MRFLLILFFVLIFASCQKKESKLAVVKPVSIFAAASTGLALAEIKPYLQMHEHIDLRIHVAASSLLAQQISYGAPCDLVLLADQSWIAELLSQKRIVPGSEINLLSNRLVMVAPLHQKIDLSHGRFVIGDPRHVPVGKYAKAALSALGIWQKPTLQFLYAPDARAALLWVEQGEAAAGIVYWSDALSSKKVSIVSLISENLHPPIRYPLAICKNGDLIQAKRVQDFLKGNVAQGVFKKHGFLPFSANLQERGQKGGF
jgi:molybdate transport system substrate-binding protein